MRSPYLCLKSLVELSTIPFKEKSPAKLAALNPKSKNKTWPVSFSVALDCFFLVKKSTVMAPPFNSTGESEPRAKLVSLATSAMLAIPNIIGVSSLPLASTSINDISSFCYNIGKLDLEFWPNISEQEIR